MERRLWGVGSSNDYECTVQIIRIFDIKQQCDWCREGGQEDFRVIGTGGDGGGVDGSGFSLETATMVRNMRSRFSIPF